VQFVFAVPQCLHFAEHDVHSELLPAGHAVQFAIVVVHCVLEVLHGVHALAVSSVVSSGQESMRVKFY
jgi:uncharacterized membrane protein